MASPFILCLTERYLAHITFVHGELLQLQGMSKELGLLSSKRLRVIKLTFYKSFHSFKSFNIPLSPVYQF